ncbi:MAG TPA: hypothetical protein VGJ94_18095 [Syntrophorhabdaceae bacterium]
MKKLWSAVLASALLVMWLGLAPAVAEGPKKKENGKPGAVLAEVMSVTASVEAIDQAKRTLTLKLPDGTKKTVKVGKEVINFDRIKAGDQLKTTYYESVAVFVRKSDEPPVETEVGTVRVAPKGAKPGIMVADISEITAKVEAIDYKNRMVTLKGPEGQSGTFTVDRRVKRFMAIKPGDELVVRITDALAVAVETP